MKQWYIGQEIVCIETHHRGVVVKDEIYKIRGLKICGCGICGKTVIDVGVKAHNSHDYCRESKTPNPNTDGIWWLSENRFAPLDELCDITELTEHLLTTKPFEV